MTRYRYNDLKGKLMGKDKNSNKLNVLNWILGFAILLLSALVIIYFYFIFGLEDSEKGNWGTFGDFMGGTLNPIFALFSLFAIIYTIKIQTEELELSRQELSDTKQELKESRIAQQEQSDTLRKQNKAIDLQIFENTFFELLKQHNKYLDILVSSKSLNNVSYVKYKNNDGFLVVIGPEEELEIIKSFKKINQEDRIIKNYFMTLYQLLNFITTSSQRIEINTKQYTNIIRALIDDEVLRTMALNCIAHNFKKYQEYIESYQFFEHIYIENINNETIAILNILSKFDPNAFGSNEGLKGLISAKTVEKSSLC